MARVSLIFVLSILIVHGGQAAAASSPRRHKNGTTLPWWDAEEDWGTMAAIAGVSSYATTEWILPKVCP